MLAGNYEAAYTCNGNDFIPLAGKPAEILVDQVTTVDFNIEDAPGTLTGQVDSVFFDPEAPESGFCDSAVTPTVYVFGESVVPNFVDDPVATGVVAMDMDTGLYGYSDPASGCDVQRSILLHRRRFQFRHPAKLPRSCLQRQRSSISRRLMRRPPVGSLSGEVAQALVEADSCDANIDPQVFVFEEGVTPNDTDEPRRDRAGRAGFDCRGVQVPDRRYYGRRLFGGIHLHGHKFCAGGW